MTNERISAILVYDQSDPLGALKLALERQAVKTKRARNCREALRLLQGSSPPQVVFTDTQLPDGTWADVIHLAQGACAPVNVIVVSRLVDVKFYIRAIEGGAFDFIAPPFQPAELAHVVRCAAGNALQRRQLLARTEQPRQGAAASPLLHSGQ